MKRICARRCSTRRAALLVVLTCVATALAAAPAPAAGTWLPAVDVSAAGTGTWEVRVAAGANGRAIVVWRRGDGPESIVQGVLRAPDGSFSAPVDLSGADDGAVKPRVAMNARGDAVVAWQRNAGPGSVVQAVVRPAGGGFSAPVDLSPRGSIAEDPQVAIDAAGATFVVWRRSDGPGSAVHARIGSMSGAFSAVAALSPAGLSAHSPGIAVNSAGAAIAIWAIAAAGRDTWAVQTASRPAGGSFTPPADVESGRLAVEPQVAIADSGEAIAAWSHAYIEPDPGVAVAIRPAGSASWSKDVFADVEHPQVAIAPNGAAIAVWQGSRDSLATVEGAQRAPGGPLAVLGELSAGDGTDDVRVATDESGAAVVIWQSLAHGVYRIAARVRAANEGFSAPAVLSGPAPHAFAPHVAMTGGGGAIAVFVRRSDAGLNVQATEFPPPAMPAAPPPAPVALAPASSDPPAVLGLRVSPRSFAATASGPAVRATARRIGGRVSYVLTRAATVRFTVQRADRGRRSGGRCVAQKRSNRTRARCIRWVSLAAGFTRVRAAGPDRFAFTGRLGGRALRPHNYRLVASPSAAGSRGAPARRIFAIVARNRRPASSGR